MLARYLRHDHLVPVGARWNSGVLGLDLDGVLVPPIPTAKLPGGTKTGIDQDILVVTVHPEEVLDDLLGDRPRSHPRSDPGSAR